MSAPFDPARWVTRWKAAGGGWAHDLDTGKVYLIDEVDDGALADRLALKREIEGHPERRFSIRKLMVGPIG